MSMTLLKKIYNYGFWGADSGGKDCDKSSRPFLKWYIQFEHLKVKKHYEWLAPLTVVKLKKWFLLGERLRR